MKRKKVLGICKLCKKEKELTYEHIPPKSAFNRNTKFYELSLMDYFQNAKDYVDGKLKPKAKVNQGGLGKHCLCEDCNGFLGQNYVRDYKKFAEVAYAIISHHRDYKCYEFDVSDINLLNFIKEIIAIFICQNELYFTDHYEGLREFVLDKTSSNLPDRYKVYMYLNDEGNVRSGNLMYTNTWGTICEFTFKPFGFVLSIDNPNPFIELSHVTGFKDYATNKHKNTMIILNKYPTFLPFPMDFRQIDEIK
ncbi:hypothetical protein PG614_04505 [Riemerella anatipestifer]|nr:hypothetical protein [Riemerella anatipestifer]MDY3533321.1 hypothetical protein [Riemerella anatipestifer]MDY3535203.1 hypothetical protein [Riemerella anatipestifer]